METANKLSGLDFKLTDDALEISPMHMNGNDYKLALLLKEWYELQLMDISNIADIVKSKKGLRVNGKKVSPKDAMLIAEGVKIALSLLDHTIPVLIPTDNANTPISQIAHES